ncbi:MAG TPA: hypothetical protein VK814_13750 [Acidobacteriaceae bacterium]|nr:hypothetical protein [Acidobacteriaceae bacterium]
MPKFGWFKGQSQVASVEYEADYMEMEKDFVKLYNYPATDSGIYIAHLVAAIKLDKGQDVRMLK